MARSRRREGNAMSDDEIALRAALNVLRDSVEAQRMPSGESLKAGAAEVHEQAIDRLAKALAAVQDGAALPGNPALYQAST